jgi:formate dehydrogenase major subunit
VWGNLRNYTVSLLKAWWGDAATEENESCFQYLPRINGDHSHDAMMLKMLDGGEGHVLRRVRIRPSARPTPS